MSIHLIPKALYSLAKVSRGKIGEIVVRCSGGDYNTPDKQAHIFITGEGLGYTNNFSLEDWKQDACYKRGRVLVSLLAGVGAESMDFGSCPPNVRQLSAVAHVLGIMCLGLRLNGECIRTLAEVAEPGSQESRNLEFYPCELGSGGEVIRMRTRQVLDDIRRGIYDSIYPRLVWIGGNEEESGK